uniref:Uncharacterized protein n=1 Tax=Steinernema glaseri TaxID=37863 RepID=A0A1I7Y6D2_9BILA
MYSFPELMADGTEEQLYRTLLDPLRYEKDVRPTLHHSMPTNVTFGFLLNQIVEMVRSLFALPRPHASRAFL